MLEAALDEAFRTLLDWADDSRDIGVRANADTPADAQTARNFAAEGIGLCRTEHMFFEGDRLAVMREMIFAETATTGARCSTGCCRCNAMISQNFSGSCRAARLHPPVRSAAARIPAIGKAGLRDLAEAAGPAAVRVTDRVEALSEYNPMLGMRGVRLGIAVPEIYEMQARAIFEATVRWPQAADVVPEIMIPLVSAMREVELVQGPDRCGRGCGARRDRQRFHLPSGGHGRNAARGAAGAKISPSMLLSCLLAPMT